MEGGRKGQSVDNKESMSLQEQMKENTVTNDCVHQGLFTLTLQVLRRCLDAIWASEPIYLSGILSLQMSTWKNFFLRESFIPNLLGFFIFSFDQRDQIIILRYKFDKTYCGTLNYLLELV